MGASVSGAGDVNGDGFADVIVGAPGWNDGVAAVFLGSATGIVGTDPLTANARIAGHASRVSEAGDVNADGFGDIVLGAPVFPPDAPGFPSSEMGAVMVFLGSSTGIATTDFFGAQVMFQGSLPSEWLGFSVAAAGDVDGDGFDDVIAGARVYPGSLESEGVAYVFRGSPTGIVGSTLPDAHVRIGSNQAGAVVLGNRSALSVSGAGDINGDGFADVIFGTGLYDAGEENEGAAFVYLGGLGCTTNGDCDNGLFCDGVETCDPVAGCLAGADPCPGQVCDELNGVCVNCQLDADCADGVFCNGAEACVSGVCQAGTTIDCSDGVACTADSCNEATASCGNVANNAACNNGLFCDGVETCDAVFGCQAGTPPGCNDGVACTSDSCDPVTDMCANDPIVPCCGNGTCDAGEECNTCANDCFSGAAIPPGCGNGICEPFNRENCKRCPQDCAGTRRGAFCCGNLRDGDNPVGCDDPRCSESGFACSDTPVSGSCCGDSVCEETETETNCAVDCGTGCAADADCDDSLFCNGAETCVGGLCVGGTPVNCDDAVACTADACNEATGLCNHVANDLFCADGLFCNGAEFCDVALGCQAGAAVNCDDASVCTIDSCNETTDACDNITDPAFCDDGDACTADSCSGGLCVHAPIIPCCGDSFCDAGEDACDCPQDCGSPPISESNCTDGVDEDCDGLTDCDDADCTGDPACTACKPDGEPCTTDAECCRDRCREKDGEMICD